MQEHAGRPDNEEIGPKVGEGIDEVKGMPAEELEQAHQDDAAREAAEQETEAEE